MAFRVEVTAAAKTQIQDVYHWYKRNVPSSADPWLNGLLESLTTLKQFPGRCPLAPEHNEFQEEVRQLLYGKRSNAYRILFTIQNQTVYILHVRHSAKARLTVEEIYGEDD